MRECHLNGMFGPSVCLLAGGCVVWWLWACCLPPPLELFRFTFWQKFYHLRDYIRNPAEKQDVGEQHIFLHRMLVRILPPWSFAIFYQGNLRVDGMDEINNIHVPQDQACAFRKKDL